MMATKQAPTASEIRAYCAMHASSIYVPVNRGGVFTRAALSELSAAERRGLIDRWCVNRFLPNRILSRTAGEDLPPAAMSKVTSITAGRNLKISAPSKRLAPPLQITYEQAIAYLAKPHFGNTFQISIVKELLRQEEAGQFRWPGVK